MSAKAVFVGIGIAFAYWWDFAFSFVGGAFAWRWPLAFQVIFALWVIVVVFGAPESPRWLLNHGNREEVINVLSAVDGTFRGKAFASGSIVFFFTY